MNSASIGLLPTFIAPLLLNACAFSEKPEMGGFSSIAKDPLGSLEDEPPDRRPDPHMDPVIERYGAFSLRWTEDLTKTSTNDEPDPDDLRESS